MAAHVPPLRSLRVGLTGGIASGKSLAEKIFAGMGIPVLDADQVARDVVAPGTPALQEIVNTFGAASLRPDGQLDRRAMRERVFADPGARARLEAITHPRIRAAMQQWQQAQTAPYSVLSLALIGSPAIRALLDKIVLIDVPAQTQLERLLARDGISPQLAQQMIAAQADRESRRASANVIIENTGSPEQLADQLRSLHDGLVAGE